MDKIKRINLDYIQDIYASRGFTLRLLVKDYYLTLILYLIRNVEGIYFKGGTAINKIFLNHSRLSEDIDFTLTRNIAEVKKEIAEIIQKSGLFEGITEDKNVEGFLRMIIHYSLNDQKGTVFIDLNQRGKLFVEPEYHPISHFYIPFIPQFSIKTLAREELIAEKVAASIGRNKPRDHFDVYQIIH
ncbi:MAG TPA: nucleotidyl transferase AbiEii/AbiGii toxin family protein, partial [Candidatus Nanoarchaeia archaeon]|nr:nucleotidyl transferase AbiEii/AbiGii toxin family protein [Candidatus Nanoarchaeia archaeon]